VISGFVILDEQTARDGSTCFAVYTAGGVFQTLRAQFSLAMDLLGMGDILGYSFDEGPYSDCWRDGTVVTEQWTKDREEAYRREEEIKRKAAKNKKLAGAGRVEALRKFP
jgi:hypothetical protein